LRILNDVDHLKWSR